MAGDGNPGAQRDNGGFGHFVIQMISPINGRQVQI